MSFDLRAAAPLQVRRERRDVSFRAVGWFLGDNDSGVPMHDPGTGGGYDGLTTTERNTNQGAESTLSLRSTLQQSHRLAPSFP